MKRMASASVCLNEESEETSVNIHSYENYNFSSNLFLILSVHSSSAFTEINIICENYLWDYLSSFCEDREYEYLREWQGMTWDCICAESVWGVLRCPSHELVESAPFNSISNSKWECKRSTGWLIRPTDIKEWIFQVNELWGSPWHSSLWPPV